MNWAIFQEDIHRQLMEMGAPYSTAIRILRAGYIAMYVQGHWVGRRA